MRIFTFAVLVWSSTLVMAADKIPHPPRPGLFEKRSTSGFIVDGKKFKSIQEWRNSSEYRIMVDMRNIDSGLEGVDAISDKMMASHDNKVLKQFNANRTLFQLNHLTKEYRDGAKRTMGW
jgi:hypothetical protein